MPRRFLATVTRALLVPAWPFPHGCSYRALLGLLLLAGLWWLSLRRIWRKMAKLQARLHERERIVRGLHDTFFQGIQGLLLSIQSATRRLPEGNATRAVLEETLAQSDSVMLQGRELVANLRARSRGANDLGGQLEASAKEFAQQSPAEFRLSVRGQPRDLDPHVCEELRKIGREALCNAYRHARSRRIEVTIDYRLDSLRLAIGDDGIGVDEKTLAQGGMKKHGGMPEMKESAASIGATFRVLSSPGSGTIVQVQISSRLVYPSPVRAAIKRFIGLFQGKDLEG